MIDSTAIPVTKTVTLGDVIEAIEKNGLPQITSRFFDRAFDNKTQMYGPIIAACAMGQAVVNLGVEDNLFSAFRYHDPALYQWASDKEYTLATLGGRISFLNDTRKLSYKQIAEQLRIDYDGMLDLSVTVFTQEWEVAV